MRTLRPLPGLLLVLLAALAPASPARAVSLSLQSESSPEPGLTVRHYRTSSPSTRMWVALVDLCSDRVHVDATFAPDGLQTTGAWASSQGAVLAVNGDFYKTGPRVYGQAVGRGVPWPLEQTGTDPAYGSEWFYEKYGWIAFGPDWVEYSHSKRVKRNGGPATGFSPGRVTAEVPPGTLALVSGFPELVVDGAPVTCSSPTASDCFPDRSDMRTRHPRTAMGITADRQTLILLVVDGRTSLSAGMYGAELAEVMGKLGAHVAFNLDGGGSSQMWQEGAGYLNDAKGNNGGGSYRAVANHWGVFAGSGTGKRRRPGHCASRPPCKVLGPGGGTVDEQGSCFQAFGPSQYWREVDGSGEGGHLRWTNAFRSDLPSNWAWWQLHPEQAGRYRVEVSTDPAYAVYADTPYLLHTAAGDHAIVQDQTLGSGGWVSLGSFEFGAGRGQFLAVYDNAEVSVPADQHIMADAVRLTPDPLEPPPEPDPPAEDPPAGDPPGVTDPPAEDPPPGEPPVEDPAADPLDPSDPPRDDGAFTGAGTAGCSTSGAPGSALALVLLALLALRFSFAPRTQPL
ncbi:MAG: phosphodiester glycosidase family protein [Deltaproteobacteria bacterium]|nr:phosphodiester glycosidase family protein [Deltaproteobacteria bacterium]